MGQDIKKPFSGGTIVVELRSHQRHTLLAGEVVSGIVHVSLQQQLYPVHNLTVGLYGGEDVYFERRERDGENTKTVRYTGYHEIIRLRVPLESYPDGPPRLGKWTYPFTLQTPDWLPSSSTLQNGRNNLKMGVNYRIHAQFTPVSAHEYICPKKLISSFSGHTNIQIISSQMPKPPATIRFKLESNVGGFLGFKQTTCHTTIMIDKKEYYAGEEIHLRLSIDNSECKKNLENVRVKLLRNYKCHSQ